MASAKTTLGTVSETPLASLKISTIVHIGGKHYYLQSRPLPEIEVDNDRSIEPCTVILLESDTTAGEFFERTIDRYGQVDDVWSPCFLNTVVLVSIAGSIHSVSDEGMRVLHALGATKVLFVTRPVTGSQVKEGPYFLQLRKLHAAYLLYPDYTDSFIVSTILADAPFSYTPLNASVFSDIYPGSLSVAVPSRLYFQQSGDKPLAGFRIAVKDNINIKGLRTGGSSRAYTSTYGPCEESATAIQKLLEQGAVIVGKVRTSQFAVMEWPTSDWVDYHAPFNPRADGYQSPSGSSAGSGAALAAYPWLDYSIGTDSMGSTRSPAAVHGLYTMRPSVGAVSTKGVIASSSQFDTVGGFSRDPVSFDRLAQALYGPVPSNPSPKLPVKILYPTEYWPVARKETQQILEKFISLLERFLDVQRTVISLEKIWKESNPVETPLGLGEYMKGTFGWVTASDLLKFQAKFSKDFAEKSGGAPPKLNPVVDFRMKQAAAQSREDEKRGLEQLHNFKTWFEEGILGKSQYGRSDTLLLLPWSSGEPDYRDKYREPPSIMGGGGLFFGSLSTYTGAPEIVVPVGQTPYTSRITKRTEWLPVALGILGAKGSDLFLSKLVKDMMVANNLHNAVKTGRNTFEVHEEPSGKREQQE